MAYFEVSSRLDDESVEKTGKEVVWEYVLFVSFFGEGGQGTERQGDQEGEFDG